MSRMSRTAVALAGAAAGSLMLSGAALAQKEKDTIRLAINDPFQKVTGYHLPHDEQVAFAREVYQYILGFDEYNQKLVPQLATEWKQTSPTTFEFTLRDDVHFHNGDKFDADDVVYTLNYAVDPKEMFRFKESFTYIKNVEKLGPYKVRVETKAPRASDLIGFAYRFAIVDSRLHSKLKNKADYGLVSPVGTGPYKVDSIDTQKGVLLERYEGFKGDPRYRRAPARFVHGVPMPDKQTQVAQLLTGGVDVLRNVPADTARELAQQPNIKVSAYDADTLLYLWFDGLGRSGNPVLKDVRVRKALIKAIDRKTLVKTLVPGGESARITKAICFETTVACATDSEPYAYDPEGAKKLLAEAGYKDGFDMVLSVHQPISRIGEAIVGSLREIGVRATMEALPLITYVRKRARGELTAFNGFYPTSAMPDTGNVISFFFSASRDYWGDKMIAQAMKDGEVEFDLAKRKAIYAKVMDRINEQAYILPISSLPNVYAYNKDVEVMHDLLSASEIHPSDYRWKK